MTQIEAQIANLQSKVFHLENKVEGLKEDKLIWLKIQDENDKRFELLNDAILKIASAFENSAVPHGWDKV